MKSRKLYILMTRFPDTGSTIIQAIKGCYYTHASIGLDEDLNTFYSFVVKGFIVEKITRYIKPDRDPFPCQLYELEVSQEIYDAVKREIETFVAHKPDFRYARIGMTLSLFNIPFVMKSQFFCSHFVAHILHIAGVVPLKKRATLYFPEDFRQLPGIRLHFAGNLQTMIERFDLSPVTA